MQKYLKLLRYLDFISGIASLSYGVWLTVSEGLRHSIWPSLWLCGGLLGLGLALLNPAGRIARIAARKLSGSSKPVSNADPGFPAPPSGSFQGIRRQSRP